MSVKNFMAIHPVSLRIFQSGPVQKVIDSLWKLKTSKLTSRKFSVDDKLPIASGKLREVP